jgi:hypothetical protein
MQRSAVRFQTIHVVTAAALLLFAACGGPPESGEKAETAHAAWKLYLGRPAPDTYFNFIKKNAAAAAEHGNADDAVGLEYRCRALEAMAAEAARTSDTATAEQTAAEIDDLERRDVLGVYDEILPGVKKRLLDARAKAAAVGR